MTKSDMSGLLAGLPLRTGHFLLESGLHAGAWLELDTLFLDPAALQPGLDALAAQLAVHQPSAICGPLLGGAFVAQALAMRLQLRCYYSERLPLDARPGLYQAVYRLPAGQRRRAAAERFALVDDVIRAGSAVRATAAELHGLGAQLLVVGALLVLGDSAERHFGPTGVPVLGPSVDDFEMWEPAACPLCRSGVPLHRTD